MSEVIALIPARSGSKGVPNKNKRLLGNFPLIAWSILAAKKSKFIDRIIVSTDSEEYARLAIQFGAEVPFLRPKEISHDSSTDYEFILHALDWFLENDKEPKYIAHIRPTTPFRDPALIDNAINLFKNSVKATALRSAHQMSESAYKTFEISKEGQFKRLGASNTDLDSANNGRQQFPLTFQPNGYIDILSTQFIRNNGIIHGNWVLPFITPRTQEIDTEDDFKFLEYQLQINSIFYKKIFNNKD
ncbi:NeuA CMP-N-acetylneuraminic acid synthetase [Methylophilaceae bacterium]